MLAMILIGYGIGYLLDKYLGKPDSNTYTAIFTVIFVIASMVWVIRQLLRSQDK
jgi:F0F1-type ATP synthase assembly protein I